MNSFPMSPRQIFRLNHVALLVAAWLVVPAASLSAQQQHSVANYKLANKFSRDYVQQRIHSTSVRPQWIGETDRFWYSYETGTGRYYWLVDPAAKSKTPLFDRDVLAALLTQEVKKPLDAANLELSNASINDTGTVFKFTVEGLSFEYELATAKLKNLGKAKQAPSPPPSARSAEGRRRYFSSRRGGPSQSRDPRNFSPDRRYYLYAQKHNLYLVKGTEVKSDAQDDEKAKEEKEETSKKIDDAEKKKDQKSDAGQEGGRKVDGKKVNNKKVVQGRRKKTDRDQEEGKSEEEGGENKTNQDKQVEKEAERQVKEEGKQQQQKKDDEVGKKVVERKKEDDRKDEETTEKIDDREEDEEKDDQQEDQQTTGGAGEDAGSQDGEEKSDEKKYEYDEKKAKQLTKDGEEDYSFGGDDTDRKSRPRARWSEDSQAFYVTRSDSREVAELFLVNTLSMPRPTLEKYKYPMPGEENVRNTELYYYRIDTRKMVLVDPKWENESYLNVHWAKRSEFLRFVRRDRLYRNVELCEINTKTGESKVLISESVNDANIETQDVRYVNDKQQMIWWSERTGWGHYYLYDEDGTFKNAITSGPWRASGIVEIDEEKGLLYFTGNAREATDDNVYYSHLYRCFLDGSDVTLLDPGNASHRSTLSPTRDYLVDNYSRVDLAPKSVLRNSKGAEMMVLEEADLSRLVEAGWKMPHRFKLKAADGVTDLYGNMWLPFDLNEKHKYPIIAYVYPGPQQEGVSHTFTAVSSQQQLANLGFVVIQVGHRGGSPRRSKAYASYGYFNLRDYGLADKKAAIEQLAERFEFVDIERVGIYGHSGGGFMTAAALLKEPYNEFFKVGVSSSGNHDNNVYGSYWAERYHGLKVVEVKEDEKQEEGQTERGEGQRELGRDRGERGQGYEQRKQQVQRKEEVKKEVTRQEDQKKDDGKEVEQKTDSSENGLKKTGEEQRQGRRQQVTRKRKVNAVKPNAQNAETRQEAKKQVGREQGKKQRAERQQKKSQRAGKEVVSAKEKEAEKTDANEATKVKSKVESEGEKQGNRKVAKRKKKSGKKKVSKQDGERKEEVKKIEDETKKVEKEKVEQKKDVKEEQDDQEEDEKEDEKQQEDEKKTKLEIHVPTNAELAANLKGHLLLVHGEIDNNVHPAGTMRLVDALIKANKRFDMLIIPGKRHSYGDAQPYFTQRMWEYFAEHLLGDHQAGADINVKSRVTR